MPVYRSSGYYGLAWAVIVVAMALVALVAVGVLAEMVMRG